MIAEDTVKKRKTGVGKDTGNSACIVMLLGEASLTQAFLGKYPKSEEAETSSHLNLLIY